MPPAAPGRAARRSGIADIRFRPVAYLSNCRDD
jgi:hypothetical protein